MRLQCDIMLHESLHHTPVEAANQIQVHSQIPRNVVNSHKSMYILGFLFTD